MRFVRAIWKLLVGIKDALVLLLMLLFFALLYAGLSARPDPVTDGVLALDLDGAVVEQPARAELSALASSGPKQYRLRDLIAALRNSRAAADARAAAGLDHLDAGPPEQLGVTLVSRVALDFV